MLVGGKAGRKMRKQLLKLLILYFAVFFQFYCLLCFPKHVAVIRENVMGVRDKLEEAERRVEESGEDFEVGNSKLFIWDFLYSI